MAYFYLSIAVALEIGYVYSTRAAKGMSRLWASVSAVLFSVVGIYFFTLALRDIDVAVGYSLLVGGGSVGTYVAGALFFGERVRISHALCGGLILAGIVGLQFSAAAT